MIRVARSREHPSVTNRGILLALCLQRCECDVRQRSHVLLTELVILSTPCDSLLLHVNVRPSELTNRANAMPRLICENKGESESSINTVSNLQHCFVALLKRH